MIQSDAHSVSFRNQKFPHVVSWGKPPAAIWRRAETQQVLLLLLSALYQSYLLARKRISLGVHTLHPFFPHCWVYSIGTYSSTGSKVWRLCFSGLWVLCHCMSCGGDPVLCPKRPKIGLCYSLSSYVKAWVYVPQKSWTLSKQLGSRNINRARAHLIEMSACATRWQYLVLNDVYVGDMVWKLTSAMFWFKTSDNGAVQILRVYILRIQIGTILC